jgi:methyltransferase-like protein
MKRASLFRRSGKRAIGPGSPDSSEGARAAYAEVPYPGLAFPQSHPDRLATNGRLMGMTPQPPERCRLLELGCGDGGNLVPMAASLPDSEFLGLDIDSRAIGAARERARGLEASNVSFGEADLAVLDPDELGRFDYVVAHGVYSWVPPPVAQRLLEVCRAVLERQGVAYVSYNALPGGHLRAPAREAMRFHARGLERPEQRLAAAREMLAVLAANPGDDPYRRFSAADAERVSERSDALLYHDDLEVDNRAWLFADFVAEAAARRLKYVAEADWFEMSASRLPKASTELLRRCGDDRVAREQYLDFLKCRAYRQTLLCRDELRLAAAPSRTAAANLRAAARVRPVSARAEPRGRAKLEFRTPKGATLTTDHPLLKASLLVLGEAWPRRLRFATVLERAAERLGASPTAADEGALADLWLHGYDANVIHLHAHAPPTAAAPGKRPRAAELARRQCALGYDTVTTLNHESVRLDAATRRLLELLDGARDREALARALDDVPDDSGRKRSANQLRRQLDDNLDRLAELALLQA